jgi:hypothetical protein
MAAIFFSAPHDSGEISIKPTVDNASTGGLSEQSNGFLAPAQVSFAPFPYQLSYACDS